MTLDNIKGRCHIDEGHWIFRGAMSSGYPRLWGPDFTSHGGEMRCQPARRVVWHVKTGKPIPNGWRVFGECTEKLCIAPHHITARLVAEQGAKVSASGHLKGRITRIKANRAIGRKNAILTPELIAELQSSDETGVAAARRLNVSKTTISRARRGQIRSFQPIGGLLTGLLGSQGAR